MHTLVRWTRFCPPSGRAGMWSKCVVRIVAFAEIGVLKWVFSSCFQGLSCEVGARHLHGRCGDSMVLFNYATKELTAKVVYYGPGLCGKTTNLQHIYDSLPDGAKGKMLSLATKTDRTLFFDFLPIDLGNIRGMKTKIQLYTVPGQVFYDTTRKLVLKGADGVVFVVDSQKPMLEANIDSFENLIVNLAEQNQNLKDLPHVIQYNKRDMKNVLSISMLEKHVNRYHVPYFEAVALTGDGVFETLKGVSKLVLKNLTKKYGLEVEQDKKARAESRVPHLPPVDLPKPALDREKPLNDDEPFSEEISFDESAEELGLQVEADEGALADLSFGGMADREKPVNIPHLDDSEVIELDDMAPLEVEELDEMAEIASMAGRTRDRTEARGPGVSQDDVEPISVPVNISLPPSLAGQPIRLVIDIKYEEK